MLLKTTSTHLRCQRLAASVLCLLCVAGCLNPPQLTAGEPTKTPETIALQANLNDCLNHYYHHRMLNRHQHSPWEIMHMVIGYGIDTMHYTDGAQQKRINSIAWLCYNNTCRGQRMLSLHQGLPKPRLSSGLEGHPGQFLSALALSGVSLDYPLRVMGREFTVADLVEQEKLTCRPRSELSFKLIGLSHYLDTAASWKSESGEQWDFPRLLKEELAQPVIGGTCGGTHRMLGFSYALKLRRWRDQPITGEWSRANTYVNDYHAYAFKLQNDDGSMSTQFFRRQSQTGTLEVRLATTGHVLEWLMISLDDNQLKDPRVTKAVHYLVNLLNENRRHSWGIGSLGHAIHALVLYDQRMFGTERGMRRSTISQIAATE